MLHLKLPRGRKRLMGEQRDLVLRSSWAQSREEEVKMKWRFGEDEHEYSRSPSGQEGYNPST